MQMWSFLFLFIKIDYFQSLFYPINQLQIVLDAKYELPAPTECGFAVDDALFSDCEVPSPVPLGSCGAGQEQCTTGECFPASQFCDFEKDCCDSSDEQVEYCREIPIQKLFMN